MDFPRKTLFILAIAFCVHADSIGTARAQQSTSAPASDVKDLPAAKSQTETSAQLSIGSARTQLKADPKRVTAYNDLAIGLIRRARETADPSYLSQADEALRQGIALDANDFQLQKTRVAILLARHQYPQALELVTALNHRVPDDIMTYGYLADAEIALGRYPEAEKNAQWMINLRANNTPALITGAKLRVLYGDASGALEFLTQAFSQTSPLEGEDLAWIANQIAAIQIDSGQTDLAEQTLKRADELFADYPYTTENMARVRSAQGKGAEAAQLFAQAASINHDPHILFELFHAQQVAGQTTAASDTRAKFEELANDPAISTDQSRIDLILLDAASPASAPAALKLAQREAAARQDVWTLDAYAWALYANGKYQDADAAAQKAIAVGIQSPQIFDHAAHIAQRLGRTDDANKLFRLVIQSNSTSEFATDAMRSASTAGESQAANRLDPKMVAAIPPSLVLTNKATNESPAPASTSASVSGNQSRNAPNFLPVPTGLLTPQPTGTARILQEAQKSAAADSKDAKAYARLGAAYFQNARETGDVADYQLAEEALTKSLDLVSADFSSEEALGTMAEVCMGEHRFSDALTYAHKALALGSGDISPFAIVGDAYADMGEYEKAADAYARLTPRDMTLAPRAAYARDSRLAFLKFVGGDTDAAIQLMSAAVSEGNEAQLPSENLAWLYYELGEFNAQTGDAAAADTAYLAALNAYPGDYRALAGLAKLRANHGRYDEAIVLYQKAIAVIPMPIFIAELGDLYAKTGNQAEAKKQFALVEYIGVLGHINQVLHNRDLALFYADHDMKLGESLELAQKELEVRHDVYTWDAVAWAFYKNGKLAEAAKASAKATQFGTRDAMLLFHEGMIADALGQREQAHAELDQAVKINPNFHPIYAPQAQQKLAAYALQSKATRGSNDLAR